MITTIIALACVTFATRYLFLAKHLPFTIGPKFQRFLSFSAPCVLTAIWVPIVFMQNGELVTNLHNPYILGATMAILLALKFKSLYVTTFGSLAVFFVFF
ncbi:AzlD domain-containing protein [Pseudoalteromonas luteoviolacea]|uniref:AzlD domain-containing protein n=1 Tax=Pseudoalteromonas luteoviolacea TaxID=43657 RepID=UPI001B384D41|nr:AzlD domain-containing protein [Pseudoalteromonas luteoviolacea]MBQ4810307.1 AzlD domain-containing protein [Pseudoalteromonas luteoviolacea]